MIYNIDFLIAAIVILLLILWYFLGQKRAEDLNNQVFLFFAVLGVLDVIAEFFSTYCITSPESGFGIATVFITTVFYLLQALLPFTFLCYILSMHDNRLVSTKKMLLSGLPTLVLIGVILTNPFTGKLFCFDPSRGYVKGPWYLLMYYSAILPSGCCFVPYYNLEEETWFSKSESASGDPCDIRWRSDHSAFEPFPFDNRLRRES